MFGRLRPPPSPPECLERYPAKIIKDDPLSVYESTLLKLKQGSRLEASSGTKGEENLSSSSSVFSSDTPGDSHDVTLSNATDSMAMDTCEGSVQLKSKNPSVLSMFCRYKNLGQARSSTETAQNDL